ncbi:MAG: hypothetical protein ACYCYI_09180 [Saccharofermentanales bacterium]
MKKNALTLLLVFCLLLSITSCGSSNFNETNDPSIIGEWVSEGEVLKITRSSMKFKSFGESWRYSIINDYQLEVEKDGQRNVVEYYVDSTSLTLGGISSGSVTFERK